MEEEEDEEAEAEEEEDEGQVQIGAQLHVPGRERDEWNTCNIHFAGILQAEGI